MNRNEKQIEHYRYNYKKGKIGKGSYATVYKGVDTKSKQNVAIKQIHKVDLQSGDDEEHLLNEIILKHLIQQLIFKQSITCLRDQKTQISQKYLMFFKQKIIIILYQNIVILEIQTLYLNRRILSNQKTIQLSCRIFQMPLQHQSDKEQHIEILNQQIFQLIRKEKERSLNQLILVMQRQYSIIMHKYQRVIWEHLHI